MSGRCIPKQLWGGGERGVGKGRRKTTGGVGGPGRPHPSSSWIYLCTAPPPKQPVFATFPAAANIRSAQPATSHQKIPLQALNCQFNLYFASTIGHISGNCLVSRRLPIRYKRLPVPTLTSSSRHLPAVPPPP